MASGATKQARAEQDRLAAEAGKFATKPIDEATYVSEREKLQAQQASLQAQFAAVRARAGGGTPQDRKAATQEMKNIQAQLNPINLRLFYLNQATPATIKQVQQEVTKARDEGFGKSRYSSASAATGYNPMTGKVELGRGDQRGYVATTSDSEAFATGPRQIQINLSENLGVGDGIGGYVTPGQRTQTEPPQAKPQRTRKKIQTGQPASEFANPDFVKEFAKPGQAQVDTGRMSYVIGLTESPQQATYTLDLGEYGKLKGLSPEIAREYEKTFALQAEIYGKRVGLFYYKLQKYATDLKEQGVKKVPIVVSGRTIFVTPDKLVSEFRKAQAQDPNARIAAFVPLTETLSLQAAPLGASDIKQTREGKVISTLSPIPPTPPKYEFLTPLSWKGEKLVGLGRYGEESRLGEIDISQQQIPLEKTNIVTDTINKLTGAVEYISKEGSKYPFISLVGPEILKDVYAIYPAAVNLATKYLIKPLAETIQQQSLIGPTPLKEPLTLSAVGVTSLGSAAEKLAPVTQLTPLGQILRTPQQQLHPVNVTEAVGEAEQEAGELNFLNPQTPTGQYINEFGIQSVPAAIIIAALPAGSKLAPFRIVKIAPIVEGAPRVLATGVKLGYGQGVSRLMVGRISETGKFFASIPKPQAIPSLTRLGFTEVAPRGGYAITEDVSRYMTRPQTLQYLVEKQVLQPEEAALIQKTEQRLRLTEKYPDEVLRTTLPTQPVRSLEAGKAETGTFFTLLSKEQRKKIQGLGPYYGSYTEQFYVSKPYLEMSRDIDLHIVGRKAGERAQRIAKTVATEIQEQTRPERQFFVKTKLDDVIELATGKPTGQKEIDRVVISASTLKKSEIPLELEGGQLFYHGTTKERALRILKEGFDPLKSETSQVKEGTIFLARKPTKAKGFAQISGKGVVLEVNLKPSTKILSARKLEAELGYSITDEELIQIARKRGYGAVDVGYYDDEIQILSNEAVAYIRDASKKAKTFVGKREVLGGEGREKVSELIVKSPESATKEGFQYTSMQQVLGMKVPTKTKKIKGVKIPDAFEGTQEVTVFRRQELRRSSAMLEIQPEGKGGILRPDVGREKEFTKVYGQTLTRAEQAERLGKPKEAKQLREYAEFVKAFAQKRGLWREGLGVDLAEESGVIVKPSKFESVSSGVQKATPSLLKATPHTLSKSRIESEMESEPPSPRYDMVYDTDKDYSLVSQPSRVSAQSAISRTYGSISAVKSRVVGSAVSKIESKSRIISSRFESKNQASKITSKVSTLYQGSDISQITESKPSVASRSAASNISKITGKSKAMPSAAPSILSKAQPSILSKALPVTEPLDVVKPVKPIVPIAIKLSTREEKRRAEKEANRADFIAKAFVSDVVGFAKRPEITYGRKKTALLEEQDIRKSGSRYGKLVSGSKGGLLSKSKPNLVRKFKKAKAFKL